MNITKEKVASMIDHTWLKQDASEEKIDKLCAEAKEYKFASVCINPCYVSRCARLLKDTPVKVCTVIGFPLGATSSAAKAFEARVAIADGADEVDMVVNVGKIKSGDWDFVKQDIQAVVNAVKASETLLKVIIETCLLTNDEKVKVCRIAKDCGADFVKTSTGFSTAGATPEDVMLMRKTVGDEMGVKASGGIRTTKDAIACIEAGASRLGVSAGIAIIEGMDQ